MRANDHNHAERSHSGLMAGPRDRWTSTGALSAGPSGDVVNSGGRALSAWRWYEWPFGWRCRGAGRAMNQGLAFPRMLIGTHSSTQRGCRRAVKRLVAGDVPREVLAELQYEGGPQRRLVVAKPVKFGGQPSDSVYAYALTNVLADLCVKRRLGFCQCVSWLLDSLTEPWGVLGLWSTPATGFMARSACLTWTCVVRFREHLTALEQYGERFSMPVGAPVGIWGLYTPIWALRRFVGYQHGPQQAHAGRRRRLPRR